MDLATLSSQLGATGIVVYISYKIISKLYDDMREDSMKREDKIMEHMVKQDDSMKEQSDAMKEISTTLKSMDGRICSLEIMVKEAEKR